MDQNFSLMAQSRANYYTAGSPVQFVRVELLKGDVTGEIAVCLTFKNVGTEPLTGLVIHFKCKDAAGQVLCEDDFYYEQLEAQPGDLFGSDDAVYVSDTPVSSVEIEQDRAFLNGRGVDLRSYKRVRLQTPRMLPASIAKTLQARAGNDQLVCVPQDIEQGWFCACGAFHPNEENTQVCSECGGSAPFARRGGETAPRALLRGRAGTASPARRPPRLRPFCCRAPPFPSLGGRGSAGSGKDERSFADLSEQGRFEPRRVRGAQRYPCCSPEDDGKV